MTAQAIDLLYFVLIHSNGAETFDRELPNNEEAAYKKN